MAKLIEQKTYNNLKAKILSLEMQLAQVEDIAKKAKNAAESIDISSIVGIEKRVAVLEDENLINKIDNLDKRIEALEGNPTATIDGIIED